MSNFDTLLQHTLSDTEAKVMELLHENIRRQAFFGKPWPPAKNPAKKGKKLLYQSGDLQDGYMSHIEGENIHITNTVAYAGVHNEGAEIPVTANMKKYFWAMYYKATGGLSKTKAGTIGDNARNRALNAEAAYWKSLARIRIGLATFKKCQSIYRLFRYKVIHLVLR
ncbi:MAG TPA: hypothetical protein PLM81_13530 [Ginsengibacter sp.]|nr:hypothetical protein [Ginsengibacter sp.]HRP45638.1 hypothetical protein [Ginsengibacter sp.]